MTFLDPFGLETLNDQYQDNYDKYRDIGYKPNISQEGQADINDHYGNMQFVGGAADITLQIANTPHGLGRDVETWKSQNSTTYQKSMAGIGIGLVLLKPVLKMLELTVSGLGNLTKNYCKTNKIDNAAHNAALFEKYQEYLRLHQKANPMVDSLRNTGTLPSEFITKGQAYALGWREGKALGNYAPGKQLGGDIFNNVDPITNKPLLPTNQNWFEADIYLDTSRSRTKNPGHRMIYGDKGDIFISGDHYTTFFHVGNYLK